MRVCSGPPGAEAVTLAQRDAAARFFEAARPPEGRLLEDAFATHLVRGGGTRHARSVRATRACVASVRALVLATDR
jgi:hypothetical protein